MFTIPQPDDVLSDSNVKDLAKDVICQLPLPGIEGSPLDPGEIWAVDILAAVNQTSIWETCKENDNAPCDDTVMDWLHTLNREWLERVGNRLLMQLAMTILDRSGSRIVSIDFVDNLYHGTYADEEGELCRMHAKDGTTTCHRYCTVYLVSNGKPVTLAMTYVRSDEKEADAVERGQNGSGDGKLRYASEPAVTGLLRPIPTQTHLAESYVSDTADAVFLSSSISQRQLNSINNLLQKSDLALIPV